MYMVIQYTSFKYVINAYTLDVLIESFRWSLVTVQGIDISAYTVVYNRLY